MRTTVIPVVAALFAAQACTEPEPPTPVAEKETVFEPMVDTLERAEQVDELQRSRMDSLNEQLEQAEGGESP